MPADLAQGALKDALDGLDPTRVAMVATDVTRGDSVWRCVEARVSSWGKDLCSPFNAGSFGAVAPIESYPRISAR
jgi:hypothetical protein